MHFFSTLFRHAIIRNKACLFFLFIQMSVKIKRLALIHFLLVKLLCNKWHCLFDLGGHPFTFRNYILHNLTLGDILEIAQQVCKAMSYHEGIHVVHANVAARNFLLVTPKTPLNTPTPNNSKQIESFLVKWHDILNFWLWKRSINIFTKIL